MSIVEHEGKLYDTAEEYELLREHANSIECLCDELASKSVDDAEHDELKQTAQRMFAFKLAQSYQLMDDIQELLKARAELVQLETLLRKRFVNR